MTARQSTPEEIATRVIDLHGGRDAFLAHSNAQIERLNAKWNQDAALMGRILRAHLFVEHFVTEYLQAKNPSLGDLSAARLTFAQKVELLGDADPSVAYLVPGLRRLNKIRNRLAHTLSASVTNEDRDGFLLIHIFRALRNALASPAVASVEPVDVLESFARHAGMALNAAADPWAGIWAKAIGAQSTYGS
ncbi:hypothetical protein [Stenotrophomonas bentonitica]|uniref:Uncharacterized protein n=1 Tax=Stenotrophomonas bentonitica TaxID=1450134 RepID=A0ABU9JRG3_9GAMM